MFHIYFTEKKIFLFYFWTIGSTRERRIYCRSVWNSCKNRSWKGSENLIWAFIFYSGLFFLLSWSTFDSSFPYFFFYYIYVYLFQPLFLFVLFCFVFFLFLTHHSSSFLLVFFFFFNTSPCVFLSVLCLFVGSIYPPMYIFFLFLYWVYLIFFFFFVE